MDRRKLRGRIVEKYGTIGEFCKKTGITPQAVSNVLNGRATPNTMAVLGWGHVLDIPDNELNIFFEQEVWKSELTKEAR